MLHGKTLRGGGICEWVDVPVAIVHRGLEFRDDLVRLYVYDNGVGDVMLPPAIMENIRCVTQPGRKLLDLEWQEEDMGLLQQLAVEQDAAALEELSAEDRMLPPLHPTHGVVMAASGRAALSERLREIAGEATDPWSRGLRSAAAELEKQGPKVREISEAIKALDERYRALTGALNDNERAQQQGRESLAPAALAQINADLALVQARIDALKAGDIDTAQCILTEALK
jgi:hypothetical protein